MDSLSHIKLFDRKSPHKASMVTSNPIAKSPIGNFICQTNDYGLFEA
jgi:hypothetical protein